MPSTSEPAYDHGDHGWIPEDRFGTRLAAIRAERGWNASQAAEACGLKSSDSWTNWERGTTPRDLYAVARQIAEATGVDYEWLVLGFRTGSFLTPVDDVWGQMELALDLTDPDLALVVTAAGDRRA